MQGTVLYSVYGPSKPYKVTTVLYYTVLCCTVPNINLIQVPASSFKFLVKKCNKIK